MSARTPSRGFTLLEVMVALAILGVALMAIFDLNAGAVRNHAYTKRLTVATLLARSKMTDLEQELYDKGFQNDDDEESGDFSEEGWQDFKWRARVLAPRTQGLSPDQLISAIFNVPLGGGGDDPLGGLAGMFGPKASGGGSSGGPTPDASGGIMGALGPMAGLAQPQFQQMVDQITKSVREVHLTVSWREGTEVESVDLVTHVVSLGPGSDRNGGQAAETRADDVGAQQDEKILVNPSTGVEVPPGTPGAISRAEFKRRQTEGGGAGGGAWIDPRTGKQVPAGTPGAIPQNRGNLPNSLQEAIRSGAGGRFPFRNPRSGE